MSRRHADPNAGRWKLGAESGRAERDTTASRAASWVQRPAPRRFPLALLGLWLLAGVRLVGAEPMTFDGREDIGAMLAEARANWDFAAQDAVLLLESAQFTWLQDGRQREERHRVVWIGSDFVGRTYADLRVPWDSDRQTLRVKALRTWRDGRWIEPRPTAVVETLPFALRNAPDYTGLRETMLLHDGVEVPCVLECDYVIEDKRPYRAGIEGQWIFAHGDPALTSRVTIEAPSQVRIEVRAPEGATPAVEEIPAGAPAGQTLRVYRMRHVPPAPAPATSNPAAYLPHVTWSSYASWEELGRSLRGAFEANLGLDAALRDSVAALGATGATRIDLARQIADFVQRSERRIVYDPSLLWARVRAASRTYDTGYGADLDLAVLAAALFEAAGFRAHPALLGRGPGAPSGSLPTLAEYELRGVLVQDGDRQMLYDVTRGMLESGHWTRGLRPWAPGSDVTFAPLGLSRTEIELQLHWDKDERQWNGTGAFEASGLLDPFGVRALDGAPTSKQLEQLAAAVLESLTVGEFNLVEFGGERTALRFQGEARARSRDASGRLAITIGEPAGGLQAALPHDVHLYQAARGTPVELPGTLEQVVTVTLHLDGLEVVRVPEPQNLANAAGEFRLLAERKGDKVTVSRATRLHKPTYAPDEWPALRALLLAEADAANRRILLR